MYSGTFVLTKMYSATPSRKKKEQKKQKKKKANADAVRASSEPSTVLRSFQGANTACRSVTVCGAVRASRSASSFKCGVLALPRRSRLQNGRQPSHTHCVYIFCVSFSRSSYSVRVLARMHVRCSQLLCFLLRRESESLPTVNAMIRQCVMCRVVESAVYERNLVFLPFVVVSVFS